MDEPRYFKKLTGEQCYLSPINVDDAATYVGWLNDMEVVRTLTMASFAISLKNERETLERLSGEHVYGIVTIDEDRLIGNCGLHDINHVDATAEIGIFIGDKTYWNRGFGREAMRLLLGYGFDYLSLRNIMLRVYAFNERAIASYRGLGFSEIGRRRSSVRREGTEHDVILMDLLDTEFRERYGATRWP